MSSRIEKIGRTLWLLKWGSWIGAALCVAALAAVAAYAESAVPHVGRDPKFFNHKTFPYGKYYKALQCETPYKYAFSFLWHTAGDNLAEAAKEVANPRVNLVKLDIINETCMSRGDCGKYEYLYGYTSQQFWKAVRKDNPKVKALLIKANQEAANWLLPKLRPDQECLRSTFLETHARRDDAVKVESWVAPIWQGRCQAVWNPVGAKPGLPPEGFAYSEGHGPSPVFADSRCIANPDGHLPEDGDWLAYFRKYANCKVVFGWDQNDNCIFRGQAGRIDPRKRDCKKDSSGFKPMGEAMCKAQKPVELPPEWTAEDELSFNGCKTRNPAPDGDGGFIWKQSHVPHYKAALMFPAKFGKFHSVQIWKAGKRVGTVDYARGAGFPDQAARNVKRPIWRTNRDLEKYPFNVVIRGKLDKPYVVKNKPTIPAGHHCWAVTNPRVRVD